MKFKTTFVLTLLLTIIFTSASAQNIEPPKDGAAIRLAKYQLKVETGKSATFDVFLIRSKRYKKQSFGGLETSAPEGVNIMLKKEEGELDKYIMDITADKSVKEGKYTLVLQGVGENHHKVKSAVVFLTVENKAIVHN